MATIAVTIEKKKIKQCTNPKNKAKRLRATTIAIPKLEKSLILISHYWKYYQFASNPISHLVGTNNILGDSTFIYLILYNSIHIQ